MTSPTKLCMIIRNIFVVLVIYDYFSVVVCECQLDPITVPSCPRSFQDWSLKAKDRCTMEDKYHCLITENHNEDEPNLIECCMPYKNISRGHMPRYNTIKKTIQEVACHNEYYMTNTFASNKYRESGVEHCNYKKSACVDMKRMKIYDNGSTMEDRKCYCDYKNNFKPDLPLDPNMVYFYKKDNDCIPSDCDLKFQELNMMYQCVNVCEDGEYRPEQSMDCIPKSSTTTPPVVVSINGSTAGVVIKTTLQTTTKYTPEQAKDTFERTETTDSKVILTVAMLAGSGFGTFVIITYLVIRKIFSAPGQPRNIKAKVLSHNRIEVSWLPPTDSANISYNVYCSDSSENQELQRVMEHNYVLEDLIPDTVYHIQVSATTNGGEGEKSPMIEVKTSPLVPIIELKGYAFNVDESKSISIECKIIYEEKYCPPFWEWINEDDKTNTLTIREDKKDKYFGLKSDPPYYLRILNAEMSDRGYYRCCIEYSTSNGEETVRSEKAHLIVEKAVKPGDTLIDQQTIIKVNNMTADTITIGGDGAKITVKNTSEKKKEKTNTSIGSSSSLSSESETSEMTQNSDCGQEPGEVDINKANK